MATAPNPISTWFKPSRTEDVRYLIYYAYIGSLVLFPLVYRTWRKLYLQSIKTRRIVRHSRLLPPSRYLRQLLAFRFLWWTTSSIVDAAIFITAHFIACSPTIRDERRDYGPIALEIGARTGWIALVDAILFVLTTFKLLPDRIFLVWLSQDVRRSLHRRFLVGYLICSVIHSFTYGLRLHETPHYNTKARFGIAATILSLLLPLTYSLKWYATTRNIWRKSTLLFIVAFPAIYTLLCVHTSYAYIPVGISGGAYILEKLSRLIGILSVNTRGNRIEQAFGTRDAIISCGFESMHHLYCLRVPCSREVALRTKPGSIFSLRFPDNSKWRLHQCYGVSSTFRSQDTRNNISDGYFIDFFLSQRRRNSTIMFLISTAMSEGDIITPDGSYLATIKCQIDGPYRSLNTPCSFCDFDHILIVSSFDGINVALPIALEAASGGRGNKRCKSIDFHWFMERREDALHAIKPRLIELLDRTATEEQQNDAKHKPRLRLHLTATADKLTPEISKESVLKDPEGVRRVLRKGTEEADRNLARVASATSRGRSTQTAEGKRDRSTTPDRIKRLVSNAFRKKISIAQKENEQLKRAIEYQYRLRKSFIREGRKPRSFVGPLDGYLQRELHSAIPTKTGTRTKNNNDTTYAMVFCGNDYDIRDAERRLQTALARNIVDGPSISFFSVKTGDSKRVSSPTTRLSCGM